MDYVKHGDFQKVRGNVVKKEVLVWKTLKFMHDSIIIQIFHEFFENFPQKRVTCSFSYMFPWFQVYIRN